MEAKNNNKNGMNVIEKCRERSAGNRREPQGIRPTICQ